MSNQPPQRAKRPCKVGSCKDFASNGGYCDQHQDRIRKSDRERGTSHERGYDAKWREAREQFLAVHPLCVDCRKRGYITPANVVDHITPHKGDKKLFWDETTGKHYASHAMTERLHLKIWAVGRISKQRSRQIRKASTHLKLAKKY